MDQFCYCNRFDKAVECHATRNQEGLIAVFKPPLRARPQPVGQFQQAAAGEELTWVGHVHIHSDRWLGVVVHRDTSLASVTNSDGAALAAQSAARSRDSR